MADPLNTEQAKKALGDVARGRPPRADDLTPDEAKRRLRDSTRRPDLLSLARTQPLLAVIMALGYGFIVGGNRDTAAKNS